MSSIASITTGARQFLCKALCFVLGLSLRFLTGSHFVSTPTDLECDGKSITVARKHNSFAVKTVDGIQALESVEAFKGFWNDNISELPEIVKDGRAVVAGLELYTQMFFVGQDGLSSAKVNSGHFDKKDFMEMLYSLKGLSARTLESGQVKKAQTTQRGTKRAHKDFKRPSRNTVSRAVFLYHVRPVHENTLTSCR